MSSGLISDHMLWGFQPKTFRFFAIRFRVADALASGRDTEIQDLKGAISNPKPKHRDASPGPKGRLNEPWHCVLAGVWVHSEGMCVCVFFNLQVSSYLGATGRKLIKHDFFFLVMKIT